MEIDELVSVIEALSETYSELPMASYYYDDAQRDYEEACLEADRNLPGADPWLEDDAKYRMDKAEENLIRVEKNRDTLEADLIRRLGEPGTLTAIPQWNTTVVVLQNNEFLVNGNVVDELGVMLEWMGF